MAEISIRPMTVEDYDSVHALWMTIRGFGIRSIDDSRQDIERFLRRNPDTSAVAVDTETGGIVGAILCGHDGRQGCFYHVCVLERYRRMGIGTRMAAFCMEALRREKINRVALIAFTSNDAGNAFWKQIGWNFRGDCNYYDFHLNRENITRFVGAAEENRQQ